LHTLSSADTHRALIRHSHHTLPPMPRRPRVHLDGLPLPIVKRGHNRQPCFFCEADYQRYLQWLEEALAQARCELHAYVLMTNHVHLLVTP